MLWKRVEYADVIPGRLYFVRLEDSICDNCGATIEYPNPIPMMFVAEYEETNGIRCHLWEFAMYGYCKSCRALIESTKYYFEGCPIEKIDLFKGIQ